MEKLRVSLIDVGSPRREVNEPVGIETVAGHVRAYLPDVDIDLSAVQLSENGEIPDEELRDRDVIGLSTKLNSLQATNSLLDRIKEIAAAANRDPVILLGDLYPTFAHDDMLKQHPDVVCVRGEGESALMGILETIRSVGGSVAEIKKALVAQDIQNLAMVINGKIVQTTRGTLDLNTSVLQARDLIKQVISLEGIVRTDASRGCHWGRCSFCSVAEKYGNVAWRAFPIEKVVDELAAISDAGGRSPYYNDEDFIGSDPDRAMELARQILEAKKIGRINPDLNYFISTRASTIVGADIGFIMFDPLMSLEDLAHNVDFAYLAKLNNHDARLIKNLRVQPLTKLAKKYLKSGIVSSTLNIDSLTYPYNFQDQQVQQVYDRYLDWEQGVSDFVSHIQAQSRGEVKSEELRIICKKRDQI